jgi:hypothetical protein
MLVTLRFMSIELPGHGCITTMNQISLVCGHITDQSYSVAQECSETGHAFVGLENV